MPGNAQANTHPLILPRETNHLLTNCLNADYGAVKFPFSVQTLLTLHLRLPCVTLHQRIIRSFRNWMWGRGQCGQTAQGQRCLFDSLTLTWSLMLHWLKQLGGGGRKSVYHCVYHIEYCGWLWEMAAGGNPINSNVLGNRSIIQQLSTQV